MRIFTIRLNIDQFPEKCLNKEVFYSLENLANRIRMGEEHPSLRCGDDWVLFDSQGNKIGHAKTQKNPANLAKPAPYPPYLRGHDGDTASTRENGAVVRGTAVSFRVQATAWCAGDENDPRLMKALAHEGACLAAIADDAMTAIRALLNTPDLDQAAREQAEGVLNRFNTMLQSGG